MSESQFGKGLQGMIPIVARVYRVQIPFWQEFTGYKFHFGKGVQEYESNFGKGLNGMNLFLARAYKGRVPVPYKCHFDEGSPGANPICVRIYTICYANISFSF